MVRTFVAAALLAALSGEASGQGLQHDRRVDWRAAGGGLFPETVEDAARVTPEDAPMRMPDLAQPYTDEIEAAARRHGLDAKLLHALVLSESAYRPSICSPAGACGLTQLMPATARELGVADRFDPVQNLRGGADYLARQLREFGDVRLALAAYNAGPARVRRLGRVPSIPETQAYVAAVIECYLALTAGRSPASTRDCRSVGAVP
jgi:hypothetical protein